ncbi:MAG: ectonucleotide pyrophosphatase/phosphodiesterase [Opitutaceae bacterium]
MKLRLAGHVIILLLGALGVRAAANPPTPLVLIAMDGFRWDYCDLHPEETSHLRRMRSAGVSARGLIPVFPSNTFPNHYSIVTGLYPAHHGIINNRMFDPRSGEFFVYNTPQSARQSHWWGGEPIWITAVKQGRISACSYWPGSEAEIGGTRPTYWKPFDYYERTPDERIGTVVAWFKRPHRERPSVVTYYIEEANTIGHDYGPDSPELVHGLKAIDEHVAKLQSRLAAEGVAANYVLVSDHGMTATSPERLLILDDYLDLDRVQIDDAGSTISARPTDGDVAGLEAKLRRIPHARVYRAENLPADFHLRAHPLIPSVWVVMDEGWRAETRAAAARPRKTGLPLRGDHGYDPSVAAMRGVFMAWGPSFKRGVVLPEFENIHVYNLLCAALGLKPAANDGDDRLVRAALR